jgi:hypothetical protein
VPQLERACRGYNPHNRKVPSYHPIMAHLAETTHVLRVRNRSGSVHDGKASFSFLRELRGQLLSFGYPWSTDPVSHGWSLFAPGCAAVVERARGRLRRKGPFLSLVGPAAVHPSAAHLDIRGERCLGFCGSGCSHALGVHRTAKKFQLDLFDPNDGYYEYSAITSNLDFTAANLWYFMARRGNHEKTIAQLKSGLAFHTVPTMAYAANSAWQQLVVLTRKLLTNSRIETGAQRRRRSRDHTALPVLQTIQTLGFTVFHRDAAFVRPGGRSLLRLASDPATQRLCTRIEQALPFAA